MTGESQSDCESFEEFANEDEDRTEGVCRPRVAGDCDPNTQAFAAASGGTGGTCECLANHEPSENSCVQCTGGQTSNGGRGSSCACADPIPHDRNGVCEAIKIPSVDCRPNEIVDGNNDCAVCGTNELRRAGANECECPNTHFGTVGNCQETTLPNECGPHEYVEANVCTECDENEVRGAGGSCEPCQANHIRPAEATSCTCRSDYFTGGGSCVPFLNPADDCEDTQILNRADNSCQDCGEHEVRGADGACDCQQFGEVGDCTPIVEVSTCAMNEHIVDNECSECPVDQFRGTESSCMECPTNEVRAAEAASCSCPSETHYKAGDGEPCVLHIVCGDNQARQADNTCAASCPANEDLVNGVCNCRGSQIRVNGLGECVDRVACAGGEVTEANTCQCSDNQDDVNGTCLQSCHADASRQETGCICNADYEGDGLACAACENGQRSEAGGSCACPGDQRLFTGGCAIPLECGNQVLGPDNTCTDECAGGLLNIGGVCEESREDSCGETYDYNSEMNRCVCPDGERENAAQTACEAIPAASSGGGGGGGGGAAALIAVPVILIGGYWLLGGFEYVDAAYDLTYHGENEDFHYQGQAGFDLNHGNLNSYAQAIQSNGGAVAYQSGISYGNQRYVLNYAAYESASDYDYDLNAQIQYAEGGWTISSDAAAEFNYNSGNEKWTSEASAGISAAWTAHRWNIRGRSGFAGDRGHEIGLEVRL